MNILSDTFLVKGKSHKICQDYVLQGDNYLIFCDGCSSSPHSDIGARILAHCAKRNIEQSYNFSIFLDDSKYWGYLIINRAEHIKEMLALSEESLDATLLIMWLDKKNNQIKIIGYGDGIIFVVDKNNEIEYLTIDYRNKNKIGEVISAPYYLSYQLNIERQQSYSKYLTDDNIKIQQGTKVNESVSYKEILERTIDITNLKFVGIATDGLKTFVDYKTQKAYSLEKIIKQVVDFKSLGKDFLQKRMKRMLQTLAAERVFHYDDIGIGGFYFDF